MDSEKHGFLCACPAAETTAQSTQAAASSADSIETSRGGRGRKRRERSAVTPGDSRSRADSSVRVLRVRGAGVGTSTEPRNATTTEKPAYPLRGRTTPAGSRPKNSPVTQAAIMKSTAIKASKHSVGPKLSRSGKGKGRPPHTSPATTCKTEAGMKVSLCGNKSSTLERNHDNMADPDTVLSEPPAFRGDPNDLICQPEAMTQCPTLQHKEVKKEEPEVEEENDNTFEQEVPTKIFAQFEYGVGDKTQPARKRGRQHKEDKAPRQPKRRKKPPVQYVRCEIEGCGTVLAHPRYLQHHIKYQHLLKKKYVCDHPSCGRLFRLQKQLLRHAKHHTDQRDYVCEFCARAFKSTHNLAVHRMIHTGEKPIQCEICGFTCRQKASLNWHMKKHDAEASYKFSCSICGKKFEKRDSVIAHKAKSHPEVLIAEAVAVSGGSVISNHTLVPEAVPVLRKPEQPSVSQEEVGDTLTPLQQVVYPLASHTWMDASQTQFLPLPTRVVQEQAPTLLHLTTTSPAHLSSTSHTQQIQLPSLPDSTVTSMTTADSQGTLLTLSSVTTLASQQAVLWGRETDEATQLARESELWDKVIVGERHQDIGEIIWESNREKRKEDEGIVW